jgi:hypothetical protein
MVTIGGAKASLAKKSDKNHGRYVQKGLILTEKCRPKS